jgi:uncharacterized protein YbaP (TraB family)
MPQDDIRRIAQRVSQQTRAPDVLALVDYVLKHAKPQGVVAEAEQATKPRTDRRAYMRELMRKRRAALRDQAEAGAEAGRMSGSDA